MRLHCLCLCVAWSAACLLPIAYHKCCPRPLRRCVQLPTDKAVAAGARPIGHTGGGCGGAVRILARAGPASGASSPRPGTPRLVPKQEA